MISGLMVSFCPEPEQTPFLEKNGNRCDNLSKTNGKRRANGLRTRLRSGLTSVRQSERSNAYRTIIGSWWPDARMGLSLEHHGILDPLAVRYA